MGTSIDRHSSISDYYKMGNAIPGIRIDGMNVLAVREGMRFVREHCSSGKGPMYVEMMTYRYILGWEDYEDIAQATGKGNGDVIRNLLSRCRKRLREHYVQTVNVSGI